MAAGAAGDTWHLPPHSEAAALYQRESALATERQWRVGPGRQGTWQQYCTWGAAAWRAGGSPVHGAAALLHATLIATAAACAFSRPLLLIGTITACVFSRPLMLHARCYFLDMHDVVNFVINLCVRA